MWDFLGKLALAILGPAIGSAMGGGLNALFSPAPSRRDVSRDIQTQMQNIRTPEQQQADVMAVEANRQRQATFSQLSKEYSAAQTAGPNAFWDPYEEARIRREATTRAYGTYGGDAPPAQVQREVDRMMGEYRLGKSQLWSQDLARRREAMFPYTDVVRPGGVSPALSPLPRTPTPVAKAVPIDLSFIAGEPEKVGSEQGAKVAASSFLAPGYWDPNVQEAMRKGYNPYSMEPTWRQ